MTNNISKLVSIFLTLAISITAIFGCFVSVSAAETPSYVITGAQCIQNDTSASALVEFKVPQGITAGSFTIDNTDNWYSSVAVSLYSELADSSDKVNIDCDNGNVIFYIIADDNVKSYTSIVFKLDFVFSDGGIQEDADITISGLEINNLYFDEVYTDADFIGTNGQFTVGCKHSFVVSDKKVYTSEEIGYTVYNGAVCSKCGEEKSDYQVVPGTGDTSGIVDVWDGRDETGAWIGWIYSKFSGGTGVINDPYIIKYAEQLAYLTTSSASTADLTSGVYYKVDDSVKAFNMNTTGLDLSGTMTPQQVEELLADEIVGRSYWAAGVFAGNFDGNGVEIYGLHTGHMKYVDSGVEKTTDQIAALFPIVTAGASIKNVVLKNSYFYTSAESAGLVGRVVANSNFDTITIENCVVHNCYIGSTKNDKYPGVIASDVGNNAFFVGRNILVYGNEVVNAANSVKSIVGTASKCYIPEGASSNVTNNRLYDSVILGVAPYDAKGSWWFKSCDNGIFQNVYFDNTIATSGFGNYNNKNSKLTQLTSIDDAKGSAAITNMQDLDWNTKDNPDGIWFAGNDGKYPTLLKKAAVNVADSTDYNWKLLGVNIVYQNNGGFALNFHYQPSNDKDVSLYLVNAKEEYKSQVLTECTTSSFAGTTLSPDAKMFTISNLSAKDIDLLWLPTIVTTSVDESTVVYSETKQISISKYAEDVVNGNAFYSENTTEEEKFADKTVAAALINYGKASDDALAINKVESSSVATIVEKWDRTSDGSWTDWYDATYEDGDGTEANPYIITSAEELAQLCRYGCDAGVYYKVADSIKAFDMNTVAGVDLTVDNISATDVKNAVADKILGKVWFCDAPFKGNFDGNGVTIYGLCTGPAYFNQTSFDNNQKAGHSRGGLFAKIDAQTAVIKNITIKNSYSKGDPAGMVFGETLGNGGSAVLENIVVANCYIDSSGGYISGVIGGYCLYDSATNTADKVKLNNCLVYDNVVYNKDGTAARLIGTMEAYCDNGSGTKIQDTNGFKISNTVAIGCKIEKSDSYWQQNANYYSNCYTTEDFAAKNTTITKLASADAAKGSAAKVNMPALDWQTIWSAGGNGEYPLIVLTAANVNPVSKYSGTPDATSTLAGSGTEDDPYIVETADQFASIALGKRTTENLYFKVKDGIESFYMQGGEEAANLTSAAEVKAYFENKGIPTSSTWAKTANFKGHFDGNGVAVSGLFAYNIGEFAYVGLFPGIEGHTSIKNITIKNSYISANTKDALGALVGTTVWKGDNNSNNSVTFENIAVINNYICHRTNNANGASAVGGSFFDKNYASINGAIIYGNDIDNTAYTGNGLITGLVTSNGGIGSIDSANNKYQNIIALGVTPWVLKDNGDGTYSNANWYLANLDQGLLKNVYTDQSVAALQIYNSTKNSDAVLEKHNINVVDAADLQGNKVVTTMAAANLAWGETWFAGNYNEYPSFTPAGTMPSSIQSQYDAVSFDVSDVLGNGTEYHANGSMSFGVYQTALSLKANPYMSFAFAFHGVYKTNRDKIKIRFTYTENGTTKTSDEIAVPAYTGEDIKNVNGWTNTASNGRYHTFKAENIPVEALAFGIKVEANYNNTGWKDFGTYSVSGLGQEFERLNRITPCRYYETRIEAVKALLFYAQAIASRYGAQ